MVELPPEQLDAVFHALADRTRRSIVARLTEVRELSITDLSSPYDMSLAAVSKHVRVLEHAGVVERRRHGRTHFCRLNPERLRGADEWITFYTRFWDERLDALESLLEDGLSPGEGGEHSAPIPPDGQKGDT